MILLFNRIPPISIPQAMYNKTRVFKNLFFVVDESMFLQATFAAILVVNSHNTDVEDDDRADAQVR